VMSMKEQYEQVIGPEAINILSSEKAKSLSKSSTVEVQGTPVNVSAQDMFDAALVLKSKSLFSGQEAAELSSQARNRVTAGGKDFLLTYVNAMHSAETNRHG